MLIELAFCLFVWLLFFCFLCLFVCVLSCQFFVVVPFFAFLMFISLLDSEPFLTVSTVLKPLVSSLVMT